ncbi:hypothetical protein BRC83_07515 [Halobacteriales archaeon QS_1_68_17]|nr:MAG: hypothetical protein BRC83_07515 [Halobacteriales archaeon QS_1_68_17]
MSGDPGVDTRRFFRTVVLIAFVTTVFLLTAASTLPSNLFRIGAAAIGVVALVTTIIGFLIAAGSYWDG